MKVSQFTNTFPPLIGGIEASVATFSADLREQGHEVLVVTPEVDAERASTPEVLRVPAVRNIGPSGFSLRLPLPAIVDDRLEAFRPQLLHSHQPFFLGDTALRSARRWDLPLVFTHHTFYERYTDWIPLPEESSRAFLLSLTTGYANLCDAVIAPTQSVKEIIEARGIERPVTVMPSGVEVAHFAQGDRSAARERWGIPQEARVLGHLGRISKAKNLPFLVKAVLQVLEHTPDAHFLLAGEGDALAELQALWEASGVAERIHSVGALTGPAIADAYAAMDCFLFTSLTDTQGLVLLEAMAAGCPVLALDAPGARDMIVPEQTGLLFPASAAPKAYADGIEAWLARPEAAEAMRVAARERAQHFDHKACSARMADFYQGLIEDHRPGHSDFWDIANARMNTEWGLLRQKLQAVGKTLERSALGARPARVPRRPRRQPALPLPPRLPEPAGQ